MEENKSEIEKEIKEEIMKEIKKECDLTCDTKNKRHSKVSSNDCVYCLGVIGAGIYYISTAATFWMGVLGILKAFVWPAFVVYEFLNLLAK